MTFPHFFSIKSTKRLYLFLLMLSLIMAAILLWVYFYFVPAYQLELVEKRPTYGGRYNLYHDLNRDGISEKIYFHNEWKRHYIAPSQPDKDFFEQANFLNWVHHRMTYFYDCNGDNYDEIILFTKNQDFLFLSVIDWNSGKWLLDHFKLLARPSSTTRFTEGWDVGVQNANFLDIDNDGIEEMIFVLASGMSLKPRGIYIFDFETKSIIYQKEFKAQPNRNLVIYDLVAEGENQIILSTQAVGNIKDQSGFTDMKCWLFVYDLTLTPAFPPISFGEYPSKLYCTPYTIKGKRHLLLTYSYNGVKDLPSFMYLLDSEGKFVAKKPFKTKNITEPVIITEFGNSKIYTTMRERKHIISLNDNLEILSQTKTDLKALFICGVEDLDSDGEQELIVSSNNHVSIFSSKLDQLASFRIGEKADYKKDFSFKKNGIGKSVDISVNCKDFRYLLSFQKSIVFTWLPLIFLGLTGLIFAFLSYSHKAISSSNIYASYFNFSQKNFSPNNLVLDPQGRIFFASESMRSYLDLEKKPIEGQKFTYILKTFPELVSAARECIKSGKPQFCELTSKKSNQNSDKVNIIPLKSKFNSIRGYVININEEKKAVISDRLKIWTSTMRKIAHDIRTPLSSVILNLDNLQLRLEQTECLEKEDVHDDIQLMHSELGKIKDLTKSFMKFADLEHPNFEITSLEKLINESLIRFQQFISTDLKIKTKIDPVTTEVWADPQQLVLVFHILIENAIDALKGKGIIEISSIMAQDLHDSSQEYAEIEVADTGPGIPLEIKGKVFEPYISSKREGMGIGLFMAKKIIEDNGGEIGFYSKENFGTVVRFRVPLAV